MRLIDADELIKEIKSYKESYIGTPDEVNIHDYMCDFAISIVNSAATWEGEEDD